MLDSLADMEEVMKIIILVNFLLVFTLATSSQDIFDIAKNGTPEQVIEIVQKGININSRDASESTPLIYAAGSNTYKVVKILLEAGAQISSRDFLGDTPLIAAVRKNPDSQVIELLLLHGAKIDEKDHFGNSPIHIAANYRPLDINMTLIKYGAKFNTINTTTDVTPFLLSCSNPYIDVFKYYLNLTKDINYTTFLGASALSLAARRENIEIASTLLKAGAKIFTKKTRWGGNLVMEAAAGNNNPEMLRLVIQYGGDPNYLDDNGSNLLYIACINENLQNAKLLISLGNKVNQRGKGGQTPLIIASQFNKHQDLIKFLLEKGADPRLEDSKYMTAYDYMKENAALKGTDIYWELSSKRY